MDITSPEAGTRELTNPNAIFMKFKIEISTNDSNLSLDSTLQWWLKATNIVAVSTLYSNEGKTYWDTPKTTFPIAITYI